MRPADISSGSPTGRRSHKPHTTGHTMTTSRQPADFTRLDDSALISARAQMRAELQRLPPFSADHAALSALYDASLDELVERARKAWTQAI
jgi:hypothetical protein